MVIMYIAYFLVYAAETVSADLDNAMQPISCITKQNKLFVFSDQFIELSRVLSDMKNDKCIPMPFDFPHSKNVLKKIEQELLQDKLINPTSIEKCIIAHKLELPIQHNFLFEKLWSYDRNRFFSYTYYELAILTAIFKESPASQLFYSLQFQKLKKPKFNIFDQKVYVCSTGALFQPVLDEEESRFFLKKYALGKIGYTNVSVPLLNYFLLDNYSLDYYLSQNKYFFLIMEFSEILNTLYIHFFDGEDLALTLRALYLPKLKCEYDKTRNIVYIISVKPMADFKNYELIIERYTLPSNRESFVDLRSVTPDELFNESFQCKDYRFHDFFEFYVDTSDGHTYLSYDYDDKWFLYSFIPHERVGRLYQFNSLACMATMHKGSIIRADYEKGNVIVSKLNLKNNNCDEFLTRYIDADAHFYLSQSGKFALILKRGERNHTRLDLFDVDSGTRLDIFDFHHRLHTVHFRGDSSLLVKYFKQNGEKITCVLDLSLIKQRIEYARSLTAQNVIEYFKNSRFEKLRH